MAQNPKTINKEAYDSLADWYLQWVQGQASPRERFAERVLQSCASDSPHLLELGCGAGVPVTRMLLDRGARVVANDISAKQIEMARVRCPEAQLYEGDMMELTFDACSFDGAMSFYALFHLPRAEQKTLLARVYDWLRPGALFVFNLAVEDDDEIYGEMMGRGMFWSSYDVRDSEAMVQDAGFGIIEAQILEAGEGTLAEDDPDYGVSFFWIVAQKPVEK